MTPEVAQQWVEAVPGMTPVLAKQGARKGKEHVQYAYRYAYGHGSQLRHISIARPGTSEGVTVYLCQTSVSGQSYPQTLQQQAPVREWHPKGYQGKGGTYGISAATRALSSIDPQQSDSMRLSVPHVQAWQAVLAWYLDVPQTKPAATPVPQAMQGDIGSADLKGPLAASVLQPEAPALPQHTQYQALTTVRNGQSSFRALLVREAGAQCWISGVEGEALLVASHIKPWAHCEDAPDERLDAHNGLLLSALWDAAFDAGLVTLDAQWRVQASPHLHPSARAALGLDTEKFLPAIFRTPRRAAYLDYHRAHVFKAQVS